MLKAISTCPCIEKLLTVLHVHVHTVHVYTCMHVHVPIPFAQYYSTSHDTRVIVIACYVVPHGVYWHCNDVRKLEACCMNV